MDDKFTEWFWFPEISIAFQQIHQDIYTKRTYDRKKQAVLQYSVSVIWILPWLYLNLPSLV